MKNAIERKRSLYAVLLMVVLLLLCGANALAEEDLLTEIPMTKVPANRIGAITLPEGLVTSRESVIANGKVTVYVDDEKTNWTEVLMKSASREIIDVSLTLLPPDGMTKATKENFGSEDEFTLPAIEQGVVPVWFAEYDETYPLENPPQIEGSAVFVKIIFGTPTYVEPENATGAGTLICWENAAGLRQYEYVQWEIIHSDSKMREVEMPVLTTTMLSTVPAGLSPYGTTTIEQGGVTCIIDDFSKFNTLPIIIKAPNGATGARVYSDNESFEEPLSVSNGTVRLNITANSHPTFSFNKRIEPVQLDYTIVFVSGEEPEEELIDFGFVTIWLLAKEQTPYIYYNHPQGATPVDENRLTLWQGERQISNATVYRKGYGQVHLTKSSLDFSVKNGGNIRLNIDAPAGAGAYALNASGSDFIYQTDWILDASKDKRQLPSNKSVTLHDQPLFRAVPAERVLVYLPDGNSARYGGYVYVISWYTDMSAAEPFMIEYISLTQDEFREIVRNDVKQDEAQITEPVTEVTAISENDWQLIVCHDPQNGENAVHYDLHMEDARCVTHTLDGETVFYIPYPDGYSYEDTDIEYRLYHYSDNYRDYEDLSYTTLEPTENGLRFVEDHLSPFVLLWDDPAQDSTESEPSTADLPKTGDSAPVEWLIGMMLVSLMTLAYMARRKRSM